MIGAIVPYVSKIRRSYQSNDIIDRLNYQYTTMIVMLSAITLAATQYVGKPIQCWVPAEFTGAWEKYAETYCFIKGSYFLQSNDEIPNEYDRRDEAVIGYYQWVPIMLAFQAFLFYMPSLIWKAFNFKTGINVKSVLNSAALVKKKFDKGSRDTQVNKAASHLQEALEMQRELKTSTFSCMGYGKRSGIYVSWLYLMTKLLYVFNIFVQFVLLNAFLGPQYTFWGAGILSDIWHGRSWEESGHFPRVTMCDFHVRVLGNMHRWTVQCVLMINMFNEKIYVFFWFWLIFVGVLSIFSLLYWTVATVFHSQQMNFVAKYLRCTGAISQMPGPREEHLVSDFVRKFLRPDGVFLLRLIQTNGGDLLVGDITTALFQRFCLRRQQQQIPASPDSTAATLQR